MILLTGASGFIGKHLHAELVSQYGNDGVIALTSVPILGYNYLSHNNYDFDFDFFIENGYADLITTIIHAGAYTPKQASQANDYSKCNQNIFNTAKLLAAYLPNLQKIIYLSTLDVYGKSDMISESTLLDPVSLYGFSKLYCEKMIDSWANQHNKLYQVLRIGHVYGPGEENYQKIIPATIKKLISRQPIQIWGTGKELRAFIYIKDVVNSIMNALKLNEIVGPINLVSDNPISIVELVNRLIAISGQNINVENIAASVPSRDLIFDNSKLKKYLLPSETDLNDGLIEEWRYMSLNYEKHNL